MSLEQLCVEIEDRSSEQAAAQIKAAEDAAKRIVEAAKASAQAILEAARDEARAFSEAEGRERMAAARLEASRAMGEARDEAVRQCVAAAWEFYRAMPRRAGYGVRLRSWAKKALEELDTPGAVLRANHADLNILRSAGFKVAASPIECSGGVRAETRDGRIAVDYTLEALFERKREDLLHQIHQQLFSAEDETASLDFGAETKQSRASGGKKAKAKKKSRK